MCSHAWAESWLNKSVYKKMWSHCIFLLPRWHPAVLICGGWLHIHKPAWKFVPTPPQKRKSFSEVVRPWNRAFLRKGSVWRLVLCFSVNELTAQDECSSCILTPSCKIIIYCIKPVSLIARFVYSELFLSNYPLFLFVCEKILSELARINKREKQVKMLFTLLFCILSQLVVLACYKPQSLQSLSHNA